VRSNLTRCVFFSNEDADKKRMKADVVAEKLRMLEPGLEVIAHTEKIQDMGEDFIPSHDLVLGCLDNLEARLHLNAHCYHKGIPYVDAGMLGFIGKVQAVLPPETPCLECSMNKTHVKKITNEHLDEVIRNIFYYDGTRNVSEIYEIQKNPDCPHHNK
jgi:molybdopterin/thiamine biosynthesis adenylyltransferase